MQLEKGIRSGVKHKTSMQSVEQDYFIYMKEHCETSKVFDIIGGYSKNLFKNLSEAIPKDTMKIKKLIDNMQRAVLFGNYNIVRRFKAF